MYVDYIIMSKYNTNINIEGKNIRNYFQNKISEKEPTLILKNKIDNNDSYSRVCQSNQRRQPVILNEKEYDKIIRQYPEYTNEDSHIKYGTNPNNKYHYICPKYWNLKTDLPITEPEMKEHDLYKYIIPRNTNYVPKDKFIYEFTNKNGENHPYPNFITNRHPDGHCLPCCFKFGLDTTKHKKVKEQCTTGKDIAIENTQTKLVDYIINSDKFPIDKDRKGFIPISLQKLFEQDNKTCQISATNASLKIGHPCLLRNGITYNSKQSFLECISDIINDTKGNIDSLKTYMLDYLTIDKFTQIHNGNLINAFYDPSKPEITTSDMNVYKKGSKLYKILHLKQESFDKTPYSYNATFFKKVCSSFKNFTNYLMNPDSYIDYKYTWDIITELFSITLCIFEIQQIGDNPEIVDVVCPSNVYSNYKLNSGYDRIVVIIKKDNLYEPIYLFNQPNNKRDPQRIEFNKKNPKVTSILKVLKRVIKFVDTSCGNINEYIPKLNNNNNGQNKLLTLYELIQKLMIPKKNHSYRILNQIMNYSGKIIGLRVEMTSHQFITKDKYTIRGVITCIPTTIIDSINISNYKNKENDIYQIPTKMTVDRSNWSNLEDTLDFYNDDHILKISQKIKNVLVKDRYITGFITDSDQLIEISGKEISENTNKHIFNNPDDPLYDMYSEYKPYKGHYPSYAEDQQISLMPSSNDNDQSVTIRSSIYADILLDSAQYSFFRNIIKVRLHQNPHISNIINNIIENNTTTTTKTNSDNPKNIKKIMTELKKLLHNKVVFITEIPETTQIEMLLNSDMMDNKKIKLIKYNENDITYYSRIAGELLYNNRMREYILNSSIHLALYKTTYDINENEKILTETEINEYYNTLERSIEYPNNYNFYDMVDPYDASKYPIIDDSYSFYKKTHLAPPNVCDTILPKENYEVPQYLKSYITPDFKSKFKIITFKKEYSYCNIVKLLQHYGQPYKSIIEIKEDLIKLYQPLLASTEIDAVKYIYKILERQGKKELIEELKTDINLSIINLIQEDHYWLTSLDYWLLLNYYNIPCIIQYKKTSNDAVWTINQPNTNMPPIFSYIIGYGYNKTNRDTRQDGASFIVKNDTALLYDYALDVSCFKPNYIEKLKKIYEEQTKITNITEILEIFYPKKKYILM